MKKKTVYLPRQTVLKIPYFKDLVEKKLSFNEVTHKDLTLL